MELLKINLRLFEGAAAGAGSAGTGADGTGAADTGEGIVYTPRNKKASETDKVIYGSPVAEDEVQEQPEAPEEPAVKSAEQLQQEFEQMIKGDYKQQYSDNVQKLINRRFKETKTMQAQIDSTQPLIDMLAMKYGVDASDISALTSAIESDDTVWEQQAYDAGMSVEQYKQFKQLERQNEQLLQQQRARAGEEAAQAQLADWQRQAMDLQQKIPGFDLQQEAQNEEFLSLLRSGVPVEHAYKVVHMDDILNGQAANVAAQAQKQVVDNIRARGNRPAENGIVSKSGFTYKSDVKKLSRADREEIAKRAARGETITFR